MPLSDLRMWTTMTSHTAGACSNRRWHPLLGMFHTSDITWWGRTNNILKFATGSDQVGSANDIPDICTYTSV